MQVSFFRMGKVIVLLHLGYARGRSLEGVCLDEHRSIKLICIFFLFVGLNVGVNGKWGV